MKDFLPIILRFFANMSVQRATFMDTMLISKLQVNNLGSNTYL